MTAPVIGITISRTTSKHGYPLLSLTEAYANQIIRAGAIPVLLPLGLATERFKTLLSRVDGVLFTGGGDVHPKYYNSQDHPAVAGVDIDRDEIEIFIFHEVVAERKPFFGICRGLQVINVALGGTLYEDIKDQMPEALRHNYFPGYEREFLAHPIEITLESRLYQIVQKETADVNSLHHQGIRQLAPGLIATAHAPDGLIEGIELTDYPFGMAVQWHPEWLPLPAEMAELFQALTLAANL